MRRVQCHVVRQRLRGDVFNPATAGRSESQSLDECFSTKNLTVDLVVEDAHSQDVVLSKVDVASGWFQILRGTRPKSEQWSRVAVPPHKSPVSQRPPVSVRQPSDRSAKEKVSLHVVRDVAKIQKLEKELEHAEGPAVDTFGWFSRKDGKPKTRCCRTRRRG